METPSVTGVPLNTISVILTFGDVVLVKLASTVSWSAFICKAPVKSDEIAITVISFVSLSFGTAIQPEAKASDNWKFVKPAESDSTNSKLSKLAPGFTTISYTIELSSPSETSRTKNCSPLVTAGVLDPKKNDSGGEAMPSAAKSLSLFLN